MEIIIDLLNVAEYMAFMWDLKEIDYVEKHCLKINEYLFMTVAITEFTKKNIHINLSLLFNMTAQMVQASHTRFNSLFGHLHLDN